MVTRTVTATAVARTARLKTTRSTSAARGWLRLGGAILLSFLAVGCAAAGDPSASTSESERSASSTTPVPSEAAPSQTTAAPAELLAAGLAPLQVAAEFETTVTVDDAVAVTSAGRSMGASSQQTVTTSGKGVEYIHVPPSSWARETGGSWVQVAADEAPGSPLDVLANPSTLEVAAPSGTAVTLNATYPAAGLGLQGDPVTVAITIDGASITFTYQVETAGHRTVSATTIRPTTMLDPILAPAS